MNYYKYMYIIRIELVVALFDGCVVLALCTTRSTHTSQRWPVLQHIHYCCVAWHIMAQLVGWPAGCCDSC